MKASIWPLIRMWLIFYYHWALAEIDPLHRDVPRIVRRLNELERSA